MPHQWLSVKIEPERLPVVHPYFSLLPKPLKLVQLRPFHNNLTVGKFQSRFLGWGETSFFKIFKLYSSFAASNFSPSTFFIAEIASKFILPWVVRSAMAGYCRNLEITTIAVTENTMERAVSLRICIMELFGTLLAAKAAVEALLHLCVVSERI